MQNSRSQSTGGGSSPTPPIQFHGKNTLDPELREYYNRNHAIARKRYEQDRSKCYQRVVRELYAEIEPRERLEFNGTARVERITREQAASIILKYEWLAGDPTNKAPMGRAIEAYYGLFLNGELIGANCLGHCGGQQGNICGPEFSKQTVCLHRGATVHYAPIHAGSFLTAHTCRQAYKDLDWRCFYAYSDAAANEVGTIYYTCDWYYLGKDLGRGEGSFHIDFVSPDGKQRLTSHAINKKSKCVRELTGWDESKGRIRPYMRDAGWKPIKIYGKGKWCTFFGSKPQKAELKAASRYPLNLPRPRRNSSGVETGEE